MTEANTGCARNQGSTQFCAEAVEAHKDLREAQAEIKRLKQGLVADMADALTKMPTTNGVMKTDPIMTELAEAYAEIDRLKTRVGWLDHLDTPEGRAMHATEAVKVENEELRAEVERLRNHINSSETAFWVELGALRLSLKQVDAAVDALRADLREAQAEIEWLKSDLYHAIQALHCSAPNELMSVEEIRAWLEIRNTLSDKYKGCTP